MLTIRQLRLEIFKKFGIDAILGKCIRAKEHALSLIDAILTKHYAKLQCLC